MKSNPHLENSIGASLPNVRLNAPSTPQVTLIFPAIGDPKTSSSIASILLAVITKMQGSDDQ